VFYTRVNESQEQRSGRKINRNPLFKGKSDTSKRTEKDVYPLQDKLIGKDKEGKRGPSIFVTQRVGQLRKKGGGGGS